MKGVLGAAALFAVVLACLMVSQCEGLSSGQLQEEAKEQTFFTELEHFLKIPRRRVPGKKSPSPSHSVLPSPQRRVKSEPLRNHKAQDHHHEETPPSVEDRHKEYQHTKAFPWQEDAQWRQHYRETQSKNTKKNPARNKFQNLASRLRKPPEGEHEPKKAKPKYKISKRYRYPDEQKKAVKKPVYMHWYRDPFDEFRDKNGVLISIPLETLKRVGHFRRPREHRMYKPPRQHKEWRPPKTVNPARKINFDYSTNIDTEGRVNANFQDKGVKFAAGSYQDQVYSEWFVVTCEGFEYDGDPKELSTIFELANKPNLPSTSDVIPDSLLNSMNTMGAIQHSRNVVTPDSREMVSNTDQYPFSVIGRLDVGCTGTLIGPNHVLTAGHCVYDYDKGRWYNNLDFHRGKDCDPDEGEVFTWKLAITVKGWKEYGYPSYDYAIVIVEPSSPRWMTFGWSNSLHMADVQVVGYPNDKEERCMWDTSCNIGQEWNDLLGYKCDTSSGMSGGPVYRYERGNERAVVYCVHAYGADDYNACAQITRPRFTQFINWISHYN